MNFQNRLFFAWKTGGCFVKMQKNRKEASKIKKKFLKIL
jgi:hypothetical protein